MVTKQASTHKCKHTRTHTPGLVAISGRPANSCFHQLSADWCTKPSVDAVCSMLRCTRNCSPVTGRSKNTRREQQIMDVAVTNHWNSIFVFHWGPKFLNHIQIRRKAIRYKPPGRALVTRRKRRSICFQSRLSIEEKGCISDCIKQKLMHVVWFYFSI